MANLNNVVNITCEKLNERITILRPVVTVDSEGNRKRDYACYKSVWANVEVLGSMNSGESGTEVKRIVTYSIVIRVQKDIIHEHDRILWNCITLRQTSPAVEIGRKYIVISAKDLREKDG